MNTLYKKNTSSILLEYTLVLFLFFSTGPYFTWGKSIYNYFALLLVIIPLMMTLNKSRIKSNNIIYALLFGILFFWNAILTNNLLSSFFSFIVPFYLLSDIQIRAKVLDLFVLKLFPLLLLISVVSYLLVSFNIISLPTFHVDTPNSIKTYDYTSFLFFLKPNFAIGLFDRFLSFYEEPGTIGTYCGIILIFFNKKMTKKVFYIYLIVGLLTLSFFFLVILLFFFILSPFKMVSNKFNLKYIILSFLILFIVFQFFDSDFIQRTVFNRFIIDDGRLAGDNRNSADFSYYFWNTFINSPDLLFGKKGSFDISAGSFSIIKMIYLKGLLLVLFTSILYSSFFYKYKENMFLFIVYSVVFFAMMYQRPQFWSIFYFIFFTTVIESNYYFKDQKIK